MIYGGISHRQQAVTNPSVGARSRDECRWSQKQNLIRVCEKTESEAKTRTRSLVRWLAREFGATQSDAELRANEGRKSDWGARG
jgi:hypothetical protein